MPQITLALISIVVNILLDVFLKKNITIAEVDYLKPFGSWFLITLFLMELLAMLIITLINSRKGLCYVVIIIFSIFSITDYTSVMYVQQTLAALIFGLLGYLCKPIIEHYSDSMSSLKGLGWFVLMIVLLLSQLNLPIAMYINQYGNKFNFVITALLAIYSILDISVSLKNTAFFQWCGRESIILYIFQFAIIRLVLSALTISIPSFQYDEYPYYFISFLFAMLLLIPLTRFSSKYFKFAFGR